LHDGNEIDAPDCMDPRIAFVQQYLASLRIEHFAVVAGIDEFRDLLRSGDYNTYWISGGAAKLDDELSKEIRRVVFRGDALIVDGQPEKRANTFDDIVGITNKGWQIASAQTVSLTDSDLLIGDVPSLGRGLRVELHSGATSLGKFANNDPAIIGHEYGLGKGVLFAYDLLGTLTANPTLSSYQDVVTNALRYLAPVTQGSSKPKPTANPTVKPTTTVAPANGPSK
jgi:hypothetical protein